MSTVSIILPTFNSVNIVQPTLDSVLSQTFTDFELLIVDSGSTDETVAYIKTIKDPRIKLHQLANAGAEGNMVRRNRGLFIAQSKYVTFINHGDLWSADKLELQLQALESNPRAMVAYSWLDHIDMNGEFVHRGSHSMASGDVMFDLLRGNFIETSSNPMIRRDIFDIVGNFDANFRLVSDWEMWLRIAMDYEFVVVPKVQVHFRDAPDALSADTRKMEKDALKLFNHIYGRTPKASEFRSEAYGNFYEYLASRTLKGEPSLTKATEGFSFLRKGLHYEPKLAWRKMRRIACIAAKATAYTALPAQHVEAGLQLYRRNIATIKRSDQMHMA